MSDDVYSFLQQAADANELRHVDVEHNGQTQRFHYYKLVSVEDGLAIGKAAEKSRADMVFECFLRLCRHGDGSRMFGEHKRKWLHSTPLWVMEAVVDQMDIDDPAETAKKRSASPSTSETSAN